MTTSIDGYIAKYQELRSALIAAKGNEEENYNIKKQLLDLQTELNEKFGKEYGNLNLVTNAYKDHSNALSDTGIALNSDYGKALKEVADQFKDSGICWMKPGQVLMHNFPSI